MLDPKVKELINTQINKEFYSAYLYLDFSNYYYDQGLDGFAHWYDVQAQEERDHAMLMRTYLLNNGEQVTFEAVDKPDKTYASPEEPLKLALEHEQYVTSLINTIYRAAQDDSDCSDMTRRGFIRSIRNCLPEFTPHLHWCCNIKRSGEDVICFCYTGN